MAFTVTSRGSATTGTSTAANITVGNFTPSANSLLFGFCHSEEDNTASGANLNMVTPSGGGLTWTPVEVIEGTNSVPNAGPGESEYQKRAGLWRADVVTPALMGLTLDGSPSFDCWYTAGCFEVTGHDTAAPVVQTARATAFPGGAPGGQHGVSLPGALTTGNLVIAVFSASVIGPTGMDAPTFGEQPMTLLQATAPNEYEQHIVYYRVLTGAESDEIAFCTNMDGAENYGCLALVVEIAAPAAAPSAITGDVALTTAGVTVDAVSPAFVGAGPFLGTVLVGAAHLGPSTYSKGYVGTSQVFGQGGGPPVGGNTIAFTTANATVSTTGSTAVSGLWPTTISANGRYIQDQNGAPWFGIGDSVWSMVAQLTFAEMTMLLEDRAGRGFNLLLLSIPEPHYVSSPFSDSMNIDNEEPFTGTPFQSSLNEDYWNYADHLVSEAARVGITLLWTPFYLGASDSDGWGAEVNAATNAQMVTYANTLVARYGAYPNIIWLIGHDRDPSATNMARSNAAADALQAGTSHLLTVGSVQTLGGGVSAIGSVAWAGSGVSWDFDTIYDYTQEPALNTEAGWMQTPVRPVGFLEGKYEAEQEYDGSLADEPIFRSQMYGPLCSGATYAIFGNNPIWHFECQVPLYNYQGTWQSNLDSPGSRKMAIFADFVDSLDGQWASMLPDITGTFLTSGEGSGESRASARFSTTLTTGVLAVAYRPHGGSATVSFDLVELAPNDVEVRKFDPASGASVLLGSFTTNGTQSFSNLGTNAAGDGDWVLTFSAVVSGSDRTGTVAVTTSNVTVDATGGALMSYTGTVAVTTADANVEQPASVTTTIAHWHEEASTPFTSTPWTGSVVEFEGAAYRENARSAPGQHQYTYTAGTDPSGTHRPLYCYTGPWADGMTVKLVSGTALKIIEWQRGAEAWRETVLNTVGTSYTINLSDTTSGFINGPGPIPSSGWNCVLLERDDIPNGSFTAELTNFHPVTLAPDSLTATPGNALIDITFGGPYFNFEVRLNTGPWITPATQGTHQFTGLTNDVTYTVSVRAQSQYGPSAAMSTTATPSTTFTGTVAVTTDAVTVVATSGAAFDPLTAVAWAAVFWAGDPAVAPPANGANVTGWNQPGSYTADEWTVDGTPTFISSWMNAKPAIEFLQGERLKTDFAILDQDTVTVVIVGETSDTESDLCDDPIASTGDRLLLDRSGSNWRMYRGSLETTAGADAAAHLFHAKFFTDASYLAVDGTLLMDEGATNSEVNKAIALGSSNSNTAHVRCKIAFAGIYLGDLTEASVAPLLAWAQSHYGTP